MKMVKVLNSYFFGEEEIHISDALFFYGPLLLAAATMPLMIEVRAIN